MNRHALIFPNGIDMTQSHIRTRCLYRGYAFEISLNRRSTGHYPLVGTLTAIDPVSGEKRRKKQSDGISSVVISDEVHIRELRSGEELQELIKKKIMDVASKLITQLPDFNSMIGSSKMLWEMNLAEAVDLYLPAAMKKRSVKATVREKYRRKLHRLADALGPVRLDRLTGTDLRRLVDNLSNTKKIEHLKDLKLFIETAENEANCQSGLLTVIEQELGKIKVRKQNVHSKAAVKASNSDVLSNAAEEKLNERIKQGLYIDPKFMLMGFIKGTGMSLAQSLDMKVGDCYLGTDSTECFIKLRLDFASATQDYTFPAFPLESVLLHDFVKHFFPGSPDPSLYLFSTDGGKTKLDAKEFQQFCRAELQNLTYGYAQQLGVYNLVREGGTEVLRKTYQHRLEKYCGVTQQTDEGAWLFLLHRSLSRSVQADHYRGFTSESGRRCMLSYVQQDRRFLKKQKRIIDSQGMKSGRTVHRIWPADDENEQIISLELVMDDSVDADELIKVYAENGLFLSVEEIED